MSAAGPFLRPEPRPLQDPADRRSHRLPKITASVTFTAIGMATLAANPIDGPAALNLAGFVALVAGSGSLAALITAHQPRSDR